MSNIANVKYSYGSIDDMPDHLRVKLPSTVNEKETEKKLSCECIAVLQGLLDIRPMRRFGYGNVQELTSHAWFTQQQLDYTSIGRGDVALKPSFQPGNQLTKTYEEEETVANSSRSDDNCEEFRFNF